MTRRQAIEAALAARTDSQRQKREAAETAFNNPFWPLERALLWIAFRDPRLVNEAVESIDADLYDHATWKSQKLSELRERYGDPAPRPERLTVNPAAVLVLALQKGELCAIKDRIVLERSFWASVRARSLPGDVFLDREEVLKRWPLQQSPAGSAVGPRESDGPTKAVLEAPQGSRGRRGPKTGSVRRFEKADRALFPDLENKMAQGMSRSAAAKSLADAGKVAGIGSPASRAKRLAAAHSQKSTGSAENR